MGECTIRERLIQRCGWCSQTSRTKRCGNGRRGEPSRLIARELGSIPQAVRALLGKHGGVRPPSRRRSLRHLSSVEREEVSRGVLRNMVTIRERPAAVSDRIDIGHWEGDLVMGKRPSAVATLVERATRYVRVVQLPDGYKAGAVRHAIANDLDRLPPALRKSLTWDRGREMAEHQQLSAHLNMDVYFCDPRIPWQRGSNENTNRLLRQYLAKVADLRTLSIRDLDDIAERINTRPRRVLDWANSHDLFWPLVRAEGAP